MAAVPEPPRSLDHLTRRMRRLSAAVPTKPTTPVAPAAVGPVITTLGATESILRHRIRSASSWLTVSTAVSSVVVPPPQPIKEKTVVASAIASITWVNLSLVIGASFSSISWAETVTGAHRAR